MRDHPVTPHGVAVMHQSRVVVVWSGPLPNERLDDAVRLVDPTDRARIARLRRSCDRAATLTSRVLLSYAGKIAREHGFSTAETPFVLLESSHPRGRGKPVVNHAGWHASISHDTVVVAAIARVPLGVDTQSLASAPTVNEVSSIFSGAEQRWLTTHPSAGDAIRLWTAKEALLKARGTGFYSDPRLDLNNTLTQADAQLATWEPGGDSIACLALMSPDPISWPAGWAVFGPQR